MPVADAPPTAELEPAATAPEAAAVPAASTAAPENQAAETAPPDETAPVAPTAATENQAAETAPTAEAAPVAATAAPETRAADSTSADAGAGPAEGQALEPVAQTSNAEASAQASPEPHVAAEQQPQPAGETASAPAAKADERRIRAQQAWERVVNARETNETLTGVVTAAVKGGLLVDVGGIRGFLPASQVRPPQGTSIEALVKAKMPLRVIDIDQSRRRIVVSQRRALEDERRTKRRELLSSLQVGQVREGTIVRLTDFGAFVDLGGIDGLIPMRELAFERIETAADVVHIGERLSVEVLRIDEGGKKISLSRRNALADPWRDHANLLRQGTTVEGKVVAKEPRLQVEIAPGVVGTIRESDADPADYEIGEAVEVSVRFADRRTRRITLTTMHGSAAAPTQPTASGFAPLGVELGRRT